MTRLKSVPAVLPVGDDDLIAAARDIIGPLRDSSLAAAQAGRIADETLALVDAHGLFEVFRPARFGGHDVSLATASEILMLLAQGDPAVGWVAHVHLLNNLGLQSMYTDEAMSEVCARPNVKVASVASTRTFKAHSVPGGLFVEEGMWSFNSGVYHAGWDSMAAPLLNEATGQIEPRYMLVPTSDLEILDDWAVTGMRATGSTTVRMRDTLVPTARLSVGTLDKPVYTAGNSLLSRVSSLAVACCVQPAVLTGIAEGAIDIFMAKLPGRGIMHTHYKEQALAPVTHLQIGETSAKVPAAKAIIRQNSAEIDRIAETGGQLSMTDAARFRRDAGFVARTCWEAVDMLASASGGSFAMANNLLNKVWNDMKVGSQHAGISTTGCYEAYGRIRCGLDLGMRAL